MKPLALQNVLVTGASGFIGGHLVRHLVDSGCHVSCLVRSNSPVDNLRSTGARLVPGDVTDPASIKRALDQSQAGAVFHLAGLVRALRREDFNRVNARGVETVAAACAARPAPPILVVVSSLAAAGPSATDRLRLEDDAPAPLSCYGHSKLAGERAVAKYAGALPISTVRPPIVFGPGDRAVLEIFRPIARWGVHGVPGCGTNRLFSLVHVDDLVKGLLLVAEKGERMRESGPPGQGVYYIAAEETPTYAQFGLAIAAAMGRKPPVIVHLPAPVLRMVGIGGDIAAWIRGRPAWLSRDKLADALGGSWACSAAKARSQLGWIPDRCLDDRLRETARWYRQARWL